MVESSSGRHSWHSLAQQDYCLRHWLVQSNQRWLQGLLVCLMQLGQGQWLHCNNEKHIGAQPWHKRAEACLQQAIVWLYVRCGCNLLPSHRCQVAINLSNLLQCTQSFYQSWYLNVVAARIWCLRVRYGNPDYHDHHPHHNVIKAWIRGWPI